MDTGKRINSKMSKLWKFSGKTQRELAEIAGVSQTTINEYFGSNANITKKNFVNILSALGINLESIIDEKLRSQIDEKSGKDLIHAAEDISIILENLDLTHRKAFLTTAINLSKLKSGNKKITEAIERIEKNHLK